jgi:hypothetical protein
LGVGEPTFAGVSCNDEDAPKAGNLPAAPIALGLFAIAAQNQTLSRHRKAIFSEV